jgi:hypothetical protein
LSSTGEPEEFELAEPQTAWLASDSIIALPFDIPLNILVLICAIYRIRRFPLL